MIQKNKKKADVTRSAKFKKILDEQKKVEARFPKMSPEKLAQGWIDRHGPEKAAKIAQKNVVPKIGFNLPHLGFVPQPNPNLQYFYCAFRYIMNRHPKALQD